MASKNFARISKISHPLVYKTQVSIQQDTRFADWNSSLYVCDNKFLMIMKYKPFPGMNIRLKTDALYKCSLVLTV